MNEENKNEATPVEIPRTSTTAENLEALKSLLSCNEAKESVAEFITKATTLFGQTKEQKIYQTLSHIFLMVSAFICIGILGYLELLSDGTIGVLAGIIIGYFFKKES